MISRYAYSLHERAVRELVAADEAARREVIDLCDKLARAPGQRGTEQVTDAAGRPNEVAYTPRFRVVYWVDHATKEIRITDVRRY